MATSERIKPVAEAPFRSTYGEFTIRVFELAGKDHIALTKGDIEGAEDVSVRIQSACVTGLVLGAIDCDCREQLVRSFEIFSETETGALLFLRQEGRGQGLATKVKAMNNKAQGYDTLEAVEMLGLEPDIRDYKDAVDMVKSLGIKSVRLITNNPDKIAGLENEGIRVNGRIAVEIPATDQTRKHLKAKRDKTGHLLEQEL